tara:strand:- start:37 stop:423 length:387 start_codon:yes stop_codon:yes gene_type:complete
VENREITIFVDSIAVKGVLNETSTADLFWANLPMEHTISTWGDEIYFNTSIVADEEDSVPTVDLGDIAYWPPGQAICLFYGPTPMSLGKEIRPASPVNLVGKMDGDVTPLKSISSGALIRIEKLKSRG